MRTSAKRVQTCICVGLFTVALPVDEDDAGLLARIIGFATRACIFFLTPFLAFETFAFLLIAALVLFGFFGETFGFHLFLGLTQKTQIMLCVLLEVFCGDAVIAELRVAGQLVVFVDDLLGRAAHLTVRS